MIKHTSIYFYDVDDKHRYPNELYHIYDPSFVPRVGELVMFSDQDPPINNRSRWKVERVEYDFLISGTVLTTLIYIWVKKV